MSQNVAQVIKTVYKGKTAYLGVMSRHELKCFEKFVSKNITSSNDLAILSLGSNTTFTPIGILAPAPFNIKSDSDLGLLAFESNDVKTVQSFLGSEKKRAKDKAACLFIK